MQRFAVFLIGRLLLAFFSSSVLALLAQIAVFRYTRFENAPIPAGAIIGPSAGTFSIVIGTLWFAAIAILMLVGGGKFSFSLRSKKTSNANVELVEYLSSIRSSARWGMIPTVVAVVVALIAIANVKLTASTLYYLGYGGGMMVCYIDSDSPETSVSKWIGESFSDTGEGLISSERDAAKIGFTGVVRGRLIYSSKNVSYLKLVTQQFGELSSTEIVNATLAILADVDNNVPIQPIDPNAVEMSSREMLTLYQRQSLEEMLAVDFGEFLLAGYHQVPTSRISAGC